VENENANPTNTQGGAGETPPAATPNDAEALARAQAAEAAQRAAAGLTSTPGPNETPLDQGVNIAPPVTELPTAPDPQTVADNYMAAMQQTVQAQNPNTQSLTAIPEGADFLPRERVAASQQARRDRGTEIYLKNTGSKALVRDIPFTDYVMLAGIPAELRAQIDDTIRDRKTQEIAKTGTANFDSLNDAVDMYARAEQMANAVCIAAFIKPRLVMRESELQPGDPMVWLVTDVDIDDRLAFLNWINRNRQEAAMASGGATAVAGFPG